MDTVQVMGLTSCNSLIFNISDIDNDSVTPALISLLSMILPMTDLSAFPITQKWPAQYPDWIQLYSLPTPNGVKVSIMLEEIGLPYEPHRVGFDTQDQMSPEFLSLNPNNKIPAILDPNGPEDQPLALFESGAILIYLADKSGHCWPRKGAALRDDSVADVPDGRHRPDVRPARFLQ
jgi:hypothetical protein